MKNHCKIFTCNWSSFNHSFDLLVLFSMHIETNNKNTKHQKIWRKLTVVNTPTVYMYESNLICNTHNLKLLSFPYQVTRKTHGCNRCWVFQKEVKVEGENAQKVLRQRSTLVFRSSSAQDTLWIVPAWSRPFITWLRVVERDSPMTGWPCEFLICHLTSSQSHAHQDICPP